MDRLSADQFDALVQLLRLRTGPAREAARLVLIEGMTQADAARKLGLSTSSTYNAVARVRVGLQLAKLATEPT